MSISKTLIAPLAILPSVTPACGDVGVEEQNSSPCNSYSALLAENHSGFVAVINVSGEHVV